MFLKPKNYLLAVAALCALLLLSGCFARSADELYALPKQSDDYYDLQTAINGVMTGDTQYCSPLSGVNQQPVQMADLTGDGVDEAIVFVKTSTEKPLKAYVFGRQGDSYENICVIEGDGTSFDRVEYVQMDDRDGMEIVIGRQISDRVLQAIGVYGITDGQPVELVSAAYSKFTLADVDSNGLKDLFVLRLNSEEHTGVAELYRYNLGTMEREPEIPMFSVIDSVRSIQVGKLDADTCGIFVGSISGESNVVTDIFTMRSGNFVNLSSVRDLCLQSAVVRGYNVFASDVDGDGLIEIPSVTALPPYSEETAEDVYYAINWYNCSSTGSLKEKAYTYHNFASGWYLNLPDAMQDGFIVSKGWDIGGVKGLRFFSCDALQNPKEELFTIYAFTGNKRNELASADGRFTVGTKGETAFSVKLGSGSNALQINQENFSELFNFIRVDWNTGET